MGKKKEKNSEPRLIQHREIYQRMNFLYQAATLMTTITTNIPKSPPPSSPSPSPSSPSQPSTSTTSTSKQQQPSVSSQEQVLQLQQQGLSTNTTSLASLGRFYINTMKTIGTKQVLRIDPSIKRTICKRCETILLPGVTSRIRIKSRPEPHLQITCTECNASKNYPARKGYQLFSEQPENIFGSNESSSGNNVENAHQSQPPHHQKQNNQSNKKQLQSQNLKE